MFRFVLVGQQGVGKSSIYSRLSPQSSPSLALGSNQSVPIPPALFSVVTLDFPSSNFTSSTPLDSLPQVLLNAHAILFIMSDPEDPNLSDLVQLLNKYNLEQKRYVFLHQVDKFDKDDYPAIVEKAKANAKKNGVDDNHFFESSLFDGSINRTIPKIVTSLMKRYNELEEYVAKIHEACDATCVIVCDAATFLPICNSMPNSPESPTSIFEFLLKVYPKGNELKSLSFECNSSVIAYKPINDKAGIFISSIADGVTTDGLMLNITRAIPKLRSLLSVE